MKKIRVLLTVVVAMLLLFPSNILAAGSPISLFKITERVTGISPYFLSNEELERGEEYKFYNITFGNAFVHYHLNYIDYKFDENIFEFVDFKSDYGFEYKNGKIALKDNKPLSEFYVSNSPSLLWTFHLRVKENAKLGKTSVGVTGNLVEHNAKTYTIVCADYDNSSECNSNQNSGNTNNQGSQNPNDNDLPGSDINDNNNENQNSENDNKQENKNPNDNNLPESDINDNNNENQNTNTPIKEETSIFDKKTNLNLYVLITLFAIISIELLVLLIMIIRNSCIKK